ncbi:hypothetical protein HDU99_000963, partial [Rhizoclosmatium hyalinum]
MLKETDALDWVYEENSIMSTLAFKYQEKSDVSSYCSGLAASMHDYDKADVLCGAYLMDDFDATLIKSMIDLLRADSCRIMLVAPSAIKSEEPKVAL